MAETAEWRPTRLKYTVETPVNGIWGSEPNGTPNDRVCIRVGDFDVRGGGLLDADYTRRSVAANKVAGRRLREGDLLLEKSGGGALTPVGRVVVVDRDFDTQAVCSNFVARMRPLPAYDSRFLMFVHRALFESGMTRPSIKQTTGIQNLDADHYLGLVVAMPALGAQRGIASELDEELARQDAVAASIARSQGVIRKHQDSAVLRLFETDERGHSNETGNRWFPRLREGVRVTRIKHLAMKVGSGKTPKGGADVYVSEGVMFLRSQNVHHQRLLLEDVARIPPAIDHEMAPTRVREGDVLLNITGASLGRCTVFPAGMERANVNQHVCIIRPARPSAGSLIAAAMSLPAVQAQIRAMQVGGNRDGLNFEQVGNLEVPLPDPAVTAHLTEEVEQALQEHSSLLELGDRSLAVLTERRRGVVRSAILHAQPTARDVAVA